MLKKYFNWNNFFMLIAVIIAVTALYFANNLTKKLASEEKQKVELITSSLEAIINNSAESYDFKIASSIISNNTTIPLFFLDSKGHVIEDKNIDPNLDKEGKELKFKEIQATHAPIKVTISDSETQYVYSGVGIT